MMRRTFTARFAALVIGLGGLLFPGGKAGAVDCPGFCQTAEIHGPGYSVRYEVKVEQTSNERMRLLFTLDNDSSATVLLLWQRDFFVSVQNHCLKVTMGSTVGHEGNDIPRLEKIDAKPFSYSEVISIPRSQDEITCLEFVFFYLVDSDSDLSNLLFKLETDGSNWFTLGNLELTEMYYKSLQSATVRFPVESGTLEFDKLAEPDSARQ